MGGIWILEPDQLWESNSDKACNHTAYMGEINLLRIGIGLEFWRMLHDGRQDISRNLDTNGGDFRRGWNSFSNARY